ncbi:MAG: hypothetical protein AAGH17_02295 [Pseudomonadota bacterium]
MLAFILAIAAGYATPHAEPQVKKFVNDMTMDDVAMDAGDSRALTFILLMLAVTVLQVLAQSDISAFVIIAGGGLGLFGTRIVAAIRNKVG